MKGLLRKIKSRLRAVVGPTRVVPCANKKDRVLSLLAHGVPISAVVDVGVQTKTGELIATLPDRRHHLFEPVSLWHETIEKEYAQIDHQLYPIALSDKSGTAWLISTALQEDGVATHASIADTSVPVDGQRVVDCASIKIDRLDTYGDQFGQDYLLKIDVDGKEADILRGAEGCIRQASVVIVEADYSSLISRGKILEDYGFVLVDLIDRIMYGELLWQCDLVYLRQDLVTERLRPPMFDSKFWRPLP
jgi:FkbM family methyltransferase